MAKLLLSFAIGIHMFASLLMTQLSPGVFDKITTFPLSTTRLTDINSFHTSVTWNLALVGNSLPSYKNVASFSPQWPISAPFAVLGLIFLALSVVGRVCIAYPQRPTTFVGGTVYQDVALPEVLHFALMAHGPHKGHFLGPGPFPTALTLVV
jgi:hypothetical protein